MVNFGELAEAIGEMREMYRAMIAGLVADGFSDEQARRIVVAITERKDPEEDE